MDANASSCSCSRAAATGSPGSVAWNRPLTCKMLIAEPEVPQLCGRPGRLADGASIRARDQHDDGASRIPKCRKRRAETFLLHFQAGMRAKARRAAVVALQEPGPCLGQAEQPEGVSRRGRIEDNVIIAGHVAGEQPDERIEGGDLGRAGAGKLLAHSGPFLVGHRRRQLLQHAVRYSSAAASGSIFMAKRPGRQGPA